MGLAHKPRASPAQQAWEALAPGPPWRGGAPAGRLLLGSPPGGRHHPSHRAGQQPGPGRGMHMPRPHTQRAGPAQAPLCPARLQRRARLPGRATAAASLGARRARWRGCRANPARGWAGHCSRVRGHQRYLIDIYDSAAPHASSRVGWPVEAAGERRTSSCTHVAPCVHHMAVRLRAQPPARHNLLLAVWPPPPAASHCMRRPHAMRRGG